MCVVVVVFFSFPFPLFLFKLTNSGNNKTTVSPFTLWLGRHSRCMKGSELGFVAWSCALFTIYQLPSLSLS